MPRNVPSAYGRDIRCMSDADAFLSDAVGIDVVKQDAFHRITTDHILGPGGDGWGFDVRNLLGIAPEKLPAYQGILAGALRRDPRIDSAEVTLTPIKDDSGLADIQIAITCTTALGPFDLIRSIKNITAGDIEAQTR